MAFNLINCDTDSITICKPDGAPFSDIEKREFFKTLNAQFPDSIEWEDDGYYKYIIVLKSKNYVLVDDKVKYKGSALTDQKKEIALRKFLEESISYLLINRKDALLDLYNKYVREAYNITDINRWTVKKTITKKIFESERKNETKVKDAIEDQIVQEGDKIWVYTAIGPEEQKIEKGEPQYYKDGRPKMVQSTILKTPDKWVQDEDKLHYVKRVYDTIQILKNVVDIDQFPKYYLTKNQGLLSEL